MDPVIVVGAGPVGLTLALALGRGGERDGFLAHQAEQGHADRSLGPECDVGAVLHGRDRDGDHARVGLAAVRRGVRERRGAGERAVAVEFHRVGGDHEVRKVALALADRPFHADVAKLASRCDVEAIVTLGDLQPSWHQALRAVTVPSWRPDLAEINDLAEEVIRLEGYENLPSTLPRPPAGRGLTERQRLHRRVGRALAGDGFVEAPNYPFVGEQVFDQLGLDKDDPNRRVVKLVNPLSDEEPALRTTLLPGLLATLRRNDGRGSHDLALFETGLVFHPRETADGDEVALPARLPVDRRPTDEEIAAQNRALPDQPRHVAAVLAGAREQAGWWGKGRPADWADAVEAARSVARAAGAELIVQQGQYGPWHPGRCAELNVFIEYADGAAEDGTEGEIVAVGHAGELHPRVIKALGLPARSCATSIVPGKCGAISQNLRSRSSAVPRVPEPSSRSSTTAAGTRVAAADAS